MRLSQPAIELLRRLPSEWTSYEEAGLSDLYGDAWRELWTAGLVASRPWPPPDPARRRNRLGRALDDGVKRTTQVRVTGTGAHRLALIDGRAR